MMNLILLITNKRKKNQKFKIKINWKGEKKVKKNKIKNIEVKQVVEYNRLMRNGLFKKIIWNFQN